MPVPGAINVPMKPIVVVGMFDGSAEGTVSQYSVIWVMFFVSLTGDDQSRYPSLCYIALQLFLVQYCKYFHAHAGNWHKNFFLAYLVIWLVMRENSLGRLSLMS